MAPASGARTAPFTIHCLTPTACRSHDTPDTARLTIHCLTHLRQRLVEHAQHAVGLLTREDERRRQADGVLPRPEDQHAAPEHGLDERVALLDGALLRLTIAHELDADHQSLAAHVADERVLLLQLAQAAHQVLAHHAPHWPPAAPSATGSSSSPPRTRRGCRQTCWRGRRAATTSPRRARTRRRAAGPTRCPWRRSRCRP